MGTLERTLYATVADAMPLAQSVFDALARDTADPAGGVTRASYGEGEQYAHSLLARVARDLDLEVTTDAGGNLYMTLPGRDRAAPAWFVGSHLDSVPSGGNFDGAAGVVAALLSLAAFDRVGLKTKHDVSAIGFRGEESAWFSIHHIGSRAAPGHQVLRHLRIRQPGA